MSAFAVKQEYLELFLDELRERGPNVEHVVRLTRVHRIEDRLHNWWLRATYLRSHGGTFAVTSLDYHLGSRLDHPDSWPLVTRDPEVVRQKLERDHQEEARREERAAAAEVAIRAVAHDLGLAIAGGEVVVSAPFTPGEGGAG